MADKFYKGDNLSKKKQDRKRDGSGYEKWDKGGKKPAKKKK